MADQNMRILVVDDSGTMRRIVKNILRQLEFTNFEEAEDGQSALDKLRAQPFDFVICDWNMPKMSGIEVLEAALRITKRPDPNRIIRVDGEDYEVLLTKNLRVTLATIAEGETISLDAGTQGVRFERIGEDQ